jgi:hypothetical protein
MNTLIRLIPFRQLIFEQVPAIATSLFIAELFYKFHSFSLECIAFLATWYVVDAAIGVLTNIGRGHHNTNE